MPARSRARSPRKQLVRALAIGAALVASTAAEARITKVQITAHDNPTFGGHSFAGVGQYEKIAGKAFGEVNPNDPKNAMIVDLKLAPRNANGNVEYSFDFYILKPVDLGKGNHKMMYEPPNRGGKTWATLARISGGGDDPGSITDATVLDTSFLLPRGYSMVWSGWDFAAGTDSSNFNTTITLPIARNADGTSITGPAFEYIVTGAASYTLNYPAATLDKSAARLTHRVHLNDAPVMVDASGWNYDATGTKISLAAGNFVNNDIYEFSYTAKDPTVNGLGLAAVRDWNAWLRYETKDDLGTANPLAGDVTRITTEISSQPGRFLNDFRHLGFNQAENGKKVFDALMQWIAAGDGINLNLRFSQPGRTERNRQDHLFIEGRFPFANVMSTDPITGLSDSRLASCTITNTCPVAAEIYSGNEYWVKAASLLTTDPGGKVDLPDSPYSRIFYMSSEHHGTGNNNGLSTGRGNCQQITNVLSSAPVQRAMFLALDAWVDGVPPPPSRIPRLADGTLVPPLPQSGMGFPSIPGVTYVGLKTTRYLFNYGPNFYTTGIMTINPPVIDYTPGRGGYQDNPNNGAIYPSFIPRTDTDGNDIAGVRLPDVTVPVATYTGWGLRSGVWANDGCESAGQLIPFPKTQADRVATGDPRPSVAERYPAFDAYYTKAVAAIDAMVKHRLMLCEDASSELARMVTLGVNRGVPAPAVTPTPVSFRCETVPTPRCQDVRKAANSSCQASASIDNGSSDQDGDPVTLAQAPGLFGLGTTQATLSATDPSGNFNSCQAAVTVADETAPDISSLSASPSLLWPANNHFVRVNLHVSASDNCDRQATNSCRVVHIRVRDDEDWDWRRGWRHRGNHRRCHHDDDSHDARVVGRLAVELRAEKDNVYQIRVECSDASNNASSRSVNVEVGRR
jgi:hypothetical protein